MKQVEVKYAPRMRIIVRGEEWLVKKVETNSLGNQTLHVIGLSQLVKDYESMFLVDIEDDIEISLEEFRTGEKCLLYVALTRARKSACVTCYGGGLSFYNI